MPWTNRGKELLMQEGLDDKTRYVTLHLANDAQLNGHGYAPKGVPAGQINVAADGTVTLPAALEIYTANDDDAQRAIKAGLAEDAAGATPLLTPAAIADTVANPLPPAPVRGQAYRIAVTITP